MRLFRKNLREHVILVACVVEADTRDAAQDVVMALLPFNEWWIAEDDRRDGSDNDSAVFVPQGSQQSYADAIHADWLRSKT